MKAPCLDCMERHFKCHSECEKYIEYVKHNTKIYENRRREDTKWILHNEKHKDIVHRKGLAKF